MEKNGTLFELRRRTFDTPAFTGITFIEAEAKSIINHVPGNYLPFNWTINPYRGCSHACSYCLSGGTPILMADGRHRPLADIRPGDLVYGTVRRGNYRRYVTTQVLAHWPTVKPGYRITLEDGTELISSGDHRFLSNRGWKHVTGTEHGGERRPHLTVANKLMGTGRFAGAPVGGPDYQRGYVCGVARGDGHIGSYAYPPRPGRSSDKVHILRLALVDLEPLSQARAYLAELGVTTRERVFQRAAGNFQEVRAIYCASEPAVDRARELIRWPWAPSAEWAKGFLAGIFDAEGSYSGGILRISNTDPVILEKTLGCLQSLGFDAVIEPPRPNGCRAVRLRGCLQEKLRFFHTVDPATTRKRSIEGIAIKNDARLRITSIEALGVDLPMFDITTGTGDFIADGVVNHNCFARTTHTYMDMNAGRDFESKIVVKVNAPELLRKELRAKRWKGEPIAMGTATDPYQRAEGRYKIMPRIIETLTEYRNPFSILTKGTLILRDLDLLVEAAGVTDVSTAFSIGTLDEDVWRKSEPGTPHPRKRMEAVAKLNMAGIPCGVMVAPILPGITDGRDQLKAVVEAALDAGATHVSPILLHLRPGVKEVYMEWLADTFPELVPRYEQMYPKAYASTSDRKHLSAQVADIIRSARPAPRFVAARRQRDAAAAAARARRESARLHSEQLKLL